MTESPVGGVVLYQSLSVRLMTDDLDWFQSWLHSILPQSYESLKTNSFSIWTWVVLDESWKEDGSHIVYKQLPIQHSMTPGTFLEVCEQLINQLLMTLKQWEGKQPVLVLLI